MTNTEWPRCGMIFEFKEMIQAQAFAAAAKERFGLDSRVFSDAQAAANSHAYPWNQVPPVVHVDRPYWFVDKDDRTAWDAAFDLEREIEALAEKQFGGLFVGT
jgi:hypothetical protein